MDVLSRGDLLLTRLFLPELLSPLKDQSVASVGDSQESASAWETGFRGIPWGKACSPKGHVDPPLGGEPQLPSTLMEATETSSFHNEVATCF